ncbi:MAG: hypothetical protein NWE89_01310 [Candidatus Bathyarchaeota archaeon]|nr:hypothetical protein [Candidatus Bathyarchaeota archaeon]
MRSVTGHGARDSSLNISFRSEKGNFLYSDGGDAFLYLHYHLVELILRKFLPDIIPLKYYLDDLMGCFLGNVPSFRIILL